jgi:hypothetical protein
MLSHYFYRETKDKYSKILKISIFLYNTLQNIIQSITEYKKCGDCLENFLENWMQIRCAIASHNKKDLTAAKLFGFNVESHFSLTSKKILNQKLLLSSIVFYKECFLVHKMVNSSYDDKKNNTQEFQKELVSVAVNEENPFAIIRPHPGDACDLIIKVFRNEENCLYYCIDCKSELELSNNNNNNNNNKNNNRKSLEVERPQYEQMKNSIAKIEHCDIKNDMCYIYFTSYENVTKIKQYDDGGCIVIGRVDSMNFFGPAWSFYKTCRAAFNLNEHKKVRKP